MLKKAKKNSGLGQALRNDRFNKAKHRNGTNRSITRRNLDGELYVTSDTSNKQDSWVKLRSITEQKNLDEFITTAQLDEVDFTAQRLNNLKVIHNGITDLTSSSLNHIEKRILLEELKINNEKLTIPRRPNWDQSMSAVELDLLERKSFINWRRSLAQLEESTDLYITPFERNLEVWRQLWRVIERSNLIVQIVDARNPLLFRSTDLERYVKEVDKKKLNFLLVNKADMLTLDQRRSWSNYFVKHNLNFRFFSAKLAKENFLADPTSDTGINTYPNAEIPVHESQILNEIPCDSIPSIDQLSRILTVEEIEAVFIQYVKENILNDKLISTDTTTTALPKIEIGLVGYPNVGKSSFINAVTGKKNVSVSATPGKTKHFQTIHLSDSLVLCDCPGLVFPNFAATKAELVCNGVLPIDQLRDYLSPVALICERFSKQHLESIYSIRIPLKPIEQGGSGQFNSSGLLTAYATSRGFSKSGSGSPDQSRAARIILKDYVSGKLLYCELPPSS